MKGKEELKGYGIPTFTGSEYVSVDEIDKYEVSVLGVPNDMGASYRLGMSCAPNAIREHSMWKKIDGLECYDYDNRKYVSTNNLKICDLGDLNVTRGDQERTLTDLKNLCEKLIQKTFPVIIGGDHSVTYGSYIGVKNGGNFKNLGILQFDAHNDTEPDMEYFSRINHCNQFTTLFKEEHVKDMMAIGLRGVVDRKWHDFSIENNIEVITSNEFNNNSIEYTINKIKEKFKDCDGIYVTFDMDSLELSASSGCGTPKYNGNNVMKTLEVLRALKDFNIVSFDLVELNPTIDTNMMTSFIAWEVLYNFLAMGLNKDNLKNRLENLNGNK